MITLLLLCSVLALTSISSAADAAAAAAARSPHRNTRIVGGSEVDPNSIPYMVTTPPCMRFRKA